MRKRFVHKIISIFVTVLLLSSLLVPIASAQSEWLAPTDNLPFSDVNRGSWQHSPVSWAWVNGITAGTTQTTFSPNANVTRVQFVVFLYRMFGSPTPASGGHGFNDVQSPDTEVQNAVRWARQQGVTLGVDAARTIFAPNAPISRQQIITMLHRKLDLPDGSSTAFDRFPAADRNAVAGWADGPMRWAADENIIGTDGVLNPGGNATRAQTLVMLQRTVGLGQIPAPDDLVPPFQTIAGLGNTNASGAASTDPSDFTFEGTLQDMAERITFTPTVSGVHRFTIAIPPAAEASVRILRGTTIFIPWTNVRNGDSIFPRLYEDTTYIIEVSRVGAASGAFEIIHYQPSAIVELGRISGFTNLTDSIDFIGQENTYSFIAAYAGTYRFEIPRIDPEPGVRRQVYLEVRRGNNVVQSRVALGWGEGVTVQLSAGEHTLRISHSNFINGTYDLRIGAQSTSAPLDIRNHSLFNHRFQFSGQQNNYTFTARSTGEHQFILTQLPAGTSLHLQIFDPLGNVYERTLVSGQGVSLRLENNWPITMRMSHVGGPLGNFTFIVVHP